MLKSFAWWTALPVLLTAPAAAIAQTVASDQPTPVTPVPAPTAPDQIIEFSADQVTYDGDADVMTATGEVRMNREGNYLAADEARLLAPSGHDAIHEGVDPALVLAGALVVRAAMAGVRADDEACVDAGGTGGVA